MKSDENKCAVKRCRGTPSIHYLGVYICDDCWDELAGKPEEALWKKVGEDQDPRNSKNARSH